MPRNKNMKEIHNEFCTALALMYMHRYSYVIQYIISVETVTLYVSIFEASFTNLVFIYLHVNYHLRTSDDLEVFEVDQPSKDKLEEVCDLRQPVLFDYSSENLDTVCLQTSLQDSYGAFDVRIRDLQLSDDAKEERARRVVQMHLCRDYIVFEIRETPVER